jgi:methionyl-tRNA formyltransferase
VALRTAFFGTPDAAVPTLDALLGSPHEVLAVLTAPDRPRDRGMELKPSPVKERALAAGVPVLQPRTLRDEAVQAQLGHLGADVFVVCAYGLILPPAVLEATPHGCLNVHFSILPQLRGAAPVQWALIEGHERAGVTIMQMDPGLDTGPIVEIAETQVHPDDTAGSLEERLAHLGARLLVEVLGRLERGELTSRPQDDSRHTLAPKLSPADARIDWTSDTQSIIRRVRAFNPRPGAWTMVGGRRLKVWRARAVEQAQERPPGSIRAAEPPLEGLLAGTGTTEVLLEEVQPEGSRRMPAADFLRGLRQGAEDRFT